MPIAHVPTPAETGGIDDLATAVARANFKINTQQVALMTPVSTPSCDVCNWHYRFRWVLGVPLTLNYNS